MEMPMGSIITAVAVLLIHIAIKAVDNIMPNITLAGFVPVILNKDRKSVV